MTRAIDVQGIRIFAKTAPCAHSCRYCLVGQKKIVDVAFPRFVAIVERFIEWRSESGLSNFSILAGVEDSYEFSVEILKALFELQSKIGRNEGSDGIKLGGLKWRSESDMRTWLTERRDMANLKIVHASLAGCGSTHDRWNGREGDFEFLFQTMRTAAEIGLRVHQRLFVVRSTLPVLADLIDKLDEIPVKALRYLSTFVYQGLATRLEEERITEAMRDQLPACLGEISMRAGTQWLSEREWIGEYKDKIDADKPRKLRLDLEITDANIDQLEHMSCEEIVAGLTSKTAKTYAMFPSRSKLLKECADRSNRLIYASLRELEHKWFDRYLIKNPSHLAKDVGHFAA
ncbi:hypothetical protein [Methyloferula stellata]|uniref:hypothetical protein n=1 Tax=Methyloferula stellata TaxID=876270 RepID=UPI0003A45473|nr:hypothetical protein [Methyloferula stellata]